MLLESIIDIRGQTEIAREYADGLNWTGIHFKDDIDHAKWFCGEL